jgi:hypothetical protein
MGGGVCLIVWPVLELYCWLGHTVGGVTLTYGYACRVHSIVCAAQCALAAALFMCSCAECQHVCVGAAREHAM